MKTCEYQEKHVYYQKIWPVYDVHKLALLNIQGAEVSLMKLFKYKEKCPHPAL